MPLFSLQAHLFTHTRYATLDQVGDRLVVNTSSGEFPVRTIGDGIRVARMEIGSFLKRAERSAPWGLTVSVAGVSAFYGEPLPGSTPRVGPPTDPNSLVAKLRRRWRPGDSAIAALDTATEIIRAYIGGRQRRRAA
jgi:hypothetical protein